MQQQGGLRPAFFVAPERCLRAYGIPMPIIPCAACGGLIDGGPAALRAGGMLPYSSALTLSVPSLSSLTS